jgi:hypothetical protein
MNYRIAVLSVFVGIMIGSLCIGQGKPTVKTQVATDVKMLDHDKIEKLMGEVADLQNKLTALTKKYDTHTHQVLNLDVTQLPGSISCDNTVVQWTSTSVTSGVNRDPVYNVCSQLMSRGNISVLSPGKESVVTGHPRQ